MVLSGAMTEKRKPTYDIEAVKAVFSTVEKLGTSINPVIFADFGDRRPHGRDPWPFSA
jgi:hypothetical protein